MSRAAADAFMRIFDMRPICSHGLDLEHACSTCVEEGLERSASHKPKSIKAKTCKVCKAKFVPRRPMQSCCSYPLPCEALKADQIAAKSAAKRDAERRKDTKDKLAAIEKMPVLVKRAQAAFNLFIRTRDKGQTCIDCGKPFEPNKPGGSVDAGHYLSRGSAAHLKFMEDNCHAQRKNCNMPGGATRLDYRNGLIARIGLERVEAIEADQESRNYTRHELIELAVKYRAMTRELLRNE